jgi:hypothetical protein
LVELEAAPEQAARIAGAFADGNLVCHQFGVAEVTVAVIPHFIRAASRVPAAGRGCILTEAGYYATLLGVPLPPDSKHFRPPADVRVGYDRAVPVACALLAEVLALPHDEAEAVSLSAAMAGLHGHRRLATMLFKLRIYSGQDCPQCGAEFDPLTEWGQGF